MAFIQISTLNNLCSNEFDDVFRISIQLPGKLVCSLTLVSAEQDPDTSTHL